MQTAAVLRLDRSKVAFQHTEQASPSGFVCAQGESQQCCKVRSEHAVKVARDGNRIACDRSGSGVDVWDEWTRNIEFNLQRAIAQA